MHKHKYTCLQNKKLQCTCTYCPHRYPGSAPKSKPMLVDKYNHFMLGVDRLDQRMAYYQFVRKSVRWWRKVFFWLVEVMVVNAYLLYSQHTDARRKLTHKEFRRSLVLALCEEQRSANTHHPAPRRRDQTLERLRGSHFPDTATTRRDCRVCSVRGAGGQRRLTNTICADCSDHPHLCVGECFRRYHTRVL